ncbi:hypothetical protein Pla175_47520 [Pirellulimonas nuda]|uniref:PEP-CTERM protein-sorting domain-containing protein n=1 Tax=Pirellulimonas nuda TaxID=2528009 RepID=A0A518DIM2_9BACT|nr:PEP-CTERM sorting domain-containing protein [Pirellulimonas nuda]QDU91331.1 hypothetical protein Pla175_47520 [Pirellulimonas nuda]
MLLSLRAAATHTLASLLLIVGATQAPADLFINEIFFDPGGDGVELRDEFIELRGAPGMSLANHFLLFIENEDNVSHTGGAGQIDNIFDLGAASIGSNGFLTLRSGGDAAGAGGSQYSVRPGTTDLVNTGSGPGFGSGAGSSIGASDEFDEGVIENGGFTAWLIRNDGGDAVKPTIAFDLDNGNDGLDLPTGREGWVILDAIGIHAEAREAVFGRTYAPITFGVETPGTTVFVPGAGQTTVTPGLEPGGVYVATGVETEYIARWGNSTGQTAADWHISNLTDNPGSGSAGAPLDYRQSFTGSHGDLASNDPTVPPSQPTASQGRLESTKGVPYGTKLLTNVGGPNYMTGDYNGDGYIDAADYTVWRDTLGQLGNETNHPAADHNHDFMVDLADYDIWVAAFTGPLPASAGVAAASVPEPSTLVALSLVALSLATIRGTRRR